MRTKEVLPKQNEKDNWYSVSPYTAQPVNSTHSRNFGVVVFCAATTYGLCCALVLYRKNHSTFRTFKLGPSNQFLVFGIECTKVKTPYKC